MKNHMSILNNAIRDSQKQKSAEAFNAAIEELAARKGLVLLESDQA